MHQGYGMDMLRSLVYTPQKGFEAPFVAGLSKDRSKLIIRVATQESLLPHDFKAREDELSVEAKKCEQYFGTSADLTINTRIEFMRNNADTSRGGQDISDEESVKRMTLAVYENGELTMR